jgi:CRP/FNR family cyclic AMP-dependent transcriptional regulator
MKTWFSLAQQGELGARQVFPDRRVVLHRGDEAAKVYLLAEGAVEIFHEAESGASVVVKVVTAPTLLSSPEVMAGEPKYNASIRAVGRALLYGISRDRYLQLVRTNGSAAFESMRDISLAFAGAARFESSRLFSSEALLANLLLTYAAVFGKPGTEGMRIQLKRSQADLASAIGAAERSVNRIFADWKASGWVTKSRGCYIVVDEPVLVRLSGELYGALLHRWREL